MLLQRESVLIKELSKDRHPNRRYTFSTRIWFPWNYVVIKQTGNLQQNIATVVMTSSAPAPDESLLKKAQVQFIPLIYLLHPFSGNKLMKIPAPDEINIYWKCANTIITSDEFAVETTVTIYLLYLHLSLVRNDETTCKLHLSGHHLAELFTYQGTCSGTN